MMDIEKLAREAARLSGDDHLVGGDGPGFWIDIDPAADFIKHFSTLVAEEAARLCKRQADKCSAWKEEAYGIGGRIASMECAAAIREHFKA